MKTFAICLASIVVTAATVPLCIVAARRWNVVDRPGPLKPQQTPVPYFGGIAVFLGLFIGALASRPLVLVPISAALVLGVADDKLELPARLRLVGQLGIGLLVALVLPLHLPGWIGIPLLVLASVVLINGFNMLDGLDMLASGVGAVAAGGFAVLLSSPNRYLGAALSASLFAFVGYNRPPARIYLGDGGSYVIGTTALILLAGTWGVGVAGATGVLSLGLLAIPFAEVTCALVRRWRSGRAILSGDRHHPYDLLVAGGWSVAAASGIYISAQLLITIVVVSVDRGSMTTALVVVASITAAVLGAATAVGGLRIAARAHP